MSHKTQQLGLLRSLPTKQPGKFFWIVAVLLYTATKLPFLWARFLFRSFRPHPKWTLLQSLKVRLARSILHHQAILRGKSPIILEPGKEKDQFVIIPPASDDLFTGVTSDPDVQPTTITGTWYPSPPPADYNGEIILHFHGGAYVALTGKPQDSQFCGQTLIKNVTSYALLPHYRLSSVAGCRFPAALQDAISAYSYLVGQGIEASRIVVAGDSAGGHLALCLLRYINSIENNLPMPKAALLWSPVVDWVSARDPTFTSKNKNYQTDYLAEHWISWGVESFAGGLDPRDARLMPYFMPLGHSFQINVPLWICVSQLEVMRDDIVKFSREMEMVDGNTVELDEVPNVPHDLIIAAEATGFEAAAVDSARVARKFLDKIK